jgi:hypothetical protein
MLSSTLLWIVGIPGSGIHVSALATVSIENRIAQVPPRGGAESDFDTPPLFLPQAITIDRAYRNYSSGYLQLGPPGTLWQLRPYGLLNTERPIRNRFHEAEHIL